jgi:hypothetical protein
MICFRETAGNIAHVDETYFISLSKWLLLLVCVFDFLTPHPSGIENHRKRAQRVVTRFFKHAR